MSEHTVARKRSRRAPASAADTVAPRAEEPALPGVEPTSETTSETTPEPTPETAPADPKSALSYRLALGAVIFLGVLIVVGIGVLIVGLVKGWNKPALSPEKQALASFHKPVSMGLEPGYRILSSDTQPGRLILHVRSDTADEIYIIDLNDGHMIATIRGEAPKQ